MTKYHQHLYCCKKMPKLDTICDTCQQQLLFQRICAVDGVDWAAYIFIRLVIRALFAPVPRRDCSSDCMAVQRSQRANRQ